MERDLSLKCSKFMNLLKYEILFALIQVSKSTVEADVDNRFKPSCIHYET